MSEESKQPTKKELIQAQMDNLELTAKSMKKKGFKMDKQKDGSYKISKGGRSFGTLRPTAI